MSTNEPPEVVIARAEEIATNDYARDQASPGLPWAAHMLMNERRRLAEELERAQAEVIRLRAELEDARSDRDGARSAAAQLRAENVRLRDRIEGRAL